MIAFDVATSGGNVNPGTSLTWAHTCSGSQRFLVVFCRGGNSQGDRVTGVTYAGVAMTKFSQTATAPGGSQQVISGYYLINPALGANNVIVSLTSGYLEAASASYKGVRQTGQPDSINTNSDDAASSLGVNTTTVKNKCWTILGAKGSSASAGSGSTLRVSNNNIFIFDSNAAISPAGSYTMNYNSSGDDLAAILVSISPSVTSPGFMFEY